MADVKSYILRLGTALLVSIGYLDPANWATSLEAGSRFSCDLVWVILLAGLITSLVRYLSSRLNAATGKCLPKACLDEFPRGACVLLWFLSEVVLVILDAATLLGTAVGLNLLLRVPLLPGVILVAGGTSFLSDKRSALDLRRISCLLGVVVALVLLCFVVNLLFIKHDVLGALYFGVWPKLRNDSTYAAIALIGASFIAHAGTETRQISDSAMCTGTSIVATLAVMSAAAATAHTAGFAVLTLQDGFTLFEPFLGRSCAPFAFGFTLFCAGVFSALRKPSLLASSFGGLDAHMHQLVVRGAAVILASYCAWLHGNEGVYQVLLLSKAIVALQLPFILVPLIRLTASAAYMGKHKIPYLVEGVAWVLLVFLQSLDFWAVLAPMFSESDDWGPSSEFEPVSAGFSSGPIAIILQTVLIGFLVWLTFTPMKGDLLKLGEFTALEQYKHREAVKWEFGRDLHNLVEASPERFDADAVLPLPLQDISEQVEHFAGIEEMIPDDEIKGTAGVTSEQGEADFIADLSSEDVLLAADSKEDSKDETCQSDSSIETTSLPEPTEIVVSEDGSAVMVNSPEAAEIDKPETCNAGVGEGEELDKEAATNNLLDKEEDGWENLEQEDVVCEASDLGASMNSLACEGPDSVKSVRSDTTDTGPVGSGSGSLSRLSGLGRAARRQFAAVLEEFWGRLFDLHGQTIVSGTQSSTTSTPKTASDRTQQYWEGDGPYSLPNTAAKRGRRNTFQSYPAPVEAYGRTFSHLAASTSQGPYGRPLEYGSNPSLSNDFSERRYSSMRHATHQPEYDYQPATIHGYSLASYANRATSVGSPRGRPLHLDVQSLGSRTASDLNFQAAFPQYSKATSSLGFEAERLSTDRGAAYNSYMRTLGDAFSTQNSDPTTPEYDQWSPIINRTADKWNPLVYRATGELDIGRDKDAGLPTTFGHAPIGRAEYSTADAAPLSFDEISPSQTHRDGFSIQATSQSESLWSKQPFEQLFGPPGFGNHPAPRKSALPTAVSTSPTSKGVFSLPNGVEFGFEVFDHLRVCIGKLLQLEGAEWLFRLENGCDEDLVAGVAAREKSLLAEYLEPVNVSCNGARSSWQMLARSTAGGNGPGFCKDLVPGVPHCGDSCVWGSALLISFGVWCVHRVLELSLMESRPELWGKYTYVLNRLQGILEPAFSRSRMVFRPCLCLQGYRPVSKRSSPGDTSSYPFPWSWGKNTSNPNCKPASSSLYLEMIKEVETAVGSRKGRTGTAAGDVAFPKGKENLASVLKRYKRRLGNKAGNSSCSINGHLNSSSSSSGMNNSSSSSGMNNNSSSSSSSNNRRPSS